MKRYFQEEFDRVWQAADEFKKARPAFASPANESSGEKELGRLFEGAAWMTALLREKLDDSFPEIAHTLARLCWPQYIRPLPASAIIQFEPKPGLRKPAAIPVGTCLDSAPVDGAVCRFQTRSEVELQPLSLEDASWTHSESMPHGIRLKFQLKGQKLSAWKPERIRLFLAGLYSDASELYFYLRNYLKEILVKELPDGSPRPLPAACLSAPALSEDFAMLPYPSNAFPGHRLLQEYFLAPEKFLFLDVDGLVDWKPQGDGSDFELYFKLDATAPTSLALDKDSFKLFATPAVNLFKRPGAPVILDHKKTEYPVRPEGQRRAHYMAISADKVVGVGNGFKTSVYDAFHNFNPKDGSTPVYNEILRQSPLTGDPELFISVSYPGDIPESETLSLELTCSNGRLPEKLAAGDIRFATDTSPEVAEFFNLNSPTPGAQPDIGSDMLWKLTAYLGLSAAPLSRGDNFKTLLRLHVPENSHKSACLKKIDGISSFEADNVKRVIGGMMSAGSLLELKANPDFFAGKGDMFVFGEVINVFLGMNAPFNSFAALVLEDLKTGEKYKWPERNGACPLI